MELLYPQRDYILERLSICCKNLGIDQKTFEAIIEVESSYNPWAVRYEPNLKLEPFRAQEFAKSCYTTEATERMMQKCSFGLGQILLVTARDLGFKGYGPNLFDVDTNLFWSTCYFKKICTRYSSPDSRIAAYNAGSAIFTKDKKFVNQAYVDKVKKVMRKNTMRLVK